MSQYEKLTFALILKHWNPPASPLGLRLRHSLRRGEEVIGVILWLNQKFEETVTPSANEEGWDGAITASAF